MADRDNVLQLSLENTVKVLRCANSHEGVRVGQSREDTNSVFRISCTSLPLDIYCFAHSLVVVLELRTHSHSRWLFLWFLRVEGESCRFERVSVLTSYVSIAELPFVVDKKALQACTPRRKKELKLVF